MKKFINILVILFSLFAIFSCSSDVDDEGSGNEVSSYQDSSNDDNSYITTRVVTNAEIGATQIARFYKTETAARNDFYNYIRKASMNKTYNSSTAFADWDDNNWQEHSEGDYVHFLIRDGNILEFMIENGVYYEVCIFDDTGLKDSNKPGIKTNIYISRRTADNTLEQRNWIRWFTN